MQKANVEDLFAQLAGGQKFSKLDMSHAYQQIMLDESAKKYVTVSTHKGLYTYCRLPFGVASFQPFSNTPWREFSKI